MKYLLDTNAVSRHLARRFSNVQSKMASIPLSQVVTCTVVEAELRFGADKSPNTSKNLTSIEGFLASIVVLPFDSAAAREYGRLRAHLEQSGQKIGGNDMMIAAIALAHGLVVVTHNVGEFSKVPDLVVEDWEA